MAIEPTAYVHFVGGERADLELPVSEAAKIMQTRSAFVDVHRKDGRRATVRVEAVAWIEYGETVTASLAVEPVAIPQGGAVS